MTDVYKKVEHYYLTTGKDDRPETTEKKPDSLGDVLEGSKPIKKLDDGWSGGVRDAYVISSVEYPSILTIPDEGLFKNMKLAQAGEQDIPDMDGKSVWCHLCVPVGGLGSMLDYVESSLTEYIRAWEIVSTDMINPASGRQGEVILVEIQNERMYGEVMGTAADIAQSGDTSRRDGKRGPSSNDKGKHVDSKGNPKDRLRPYDASTKFPTPGGPAQKKYASYLKNTRTTIADNTKKKLGIEPIDEFRYKWKAGSDWDPKCYLLYKGDELKEWMKIHNMVGMKFVTPTQVSRVVCHPAVMDMYIKFLDSIPADMGHCGNAHGRNYGIGSFRNSGDSSGPHPAGIAIDITMPMASTLTGENKRNFVKKQVHLAQQAGFTRMGIAKGKGLAHMDAAMGHYKYPKGMWWCYGVVPNTNFTSRGKILTLSENKRSFLPYEFVTAANNDRMNPSLSNSIPTMPASVMALSHT